MTADDWLTDDPFVDPNDPAAVERDGAGASARRSAERSRPRPERAAAAGSRAAAGERRAARRPSRRERSPRRKRCPAAGRPPAARAGGAAAAEGRRRRGRRPGRGALAAAARRCWPACRSGALVSGSSGRAAPAVPRRRHGQGEGEIPKGASVSEVGDILDERGVVDSSTFFQVRDDARRQALRALPGHLHAGQRDELRRRDRRDLDAAGEADDQGHDPRGPGPRGGRAECVAEAGVSGDYLKATRGESGTSTASKYGAPKGARPRGLPLPGHLRAAGAGDRGRPRRAPARRLQAADRRRRPHLCRVEEPQRLRRAR